VRGGNPEVGSLEQFRISVKFLEEVDQKVFGVQYGYGVLSTVENGIVGYKQLVFHLLRRL
jgi:hypothetical protein